MKPSPSPASDAGEEISNKSQRGEWIPIAALAATGTGIFGALLLSRGQLPIGAALLALSVVAMCWPASIWRDVRSSELTPRQRRLGVIAACALAAFFRTYRADPPGLWGDDAINGLLAFDVLDGRITSPFQLVVHAHSNFHALSNYLIAGAFQVFGPSPLALRAPGMVANLLAVPLLYGTIAPLYGARVALLAACFFASSPLQIGHSKGLTQVVLGQFFGMLGFFLIVRGATGRRPWLLAASGMPLALALYTYHSAKLVPLIGIIAMLILLPGAPASRRHLRAAVAAAVLVFVATALPAVITYGHSPAALTGRISGTSIWSDIRTAGTLSPLWDSVWRTLAIFHYQQGPKYHWFGLGFDPGFNTVSAWLLLPGVVQSVRHLREPRHAFLLVWALIGLLAGWLSIEAPRAYRVLLATPPFYVWAALPVVALLDNAAALRRSARRSLRALAIALVLAVPVIDFNYYFYRVYSSSVFRWFQAEPLVEMARTLRARGPAWTGYVLADGCRATYETLAFLSRAWGLRLRDVVSLADVLPVHEDGDGSLFMIMRGPLEASVLMRSLYPGVPLDIRSDPQPRAWWFDRWLPLTHGLPPPAPIVAFFPVSRETAATIRGVRTAFYAADGNEIATRIDPAPRLRGNDDLPRSAAAPARVVWSGSLLAPTFGRYHFLVDTVGDASVRIDGVRVISEGRRFGRVTLAQGLHEFHAEAPALPPAFQLQWQLPGQSPEPIPPALFFRDAEVHGLLAEYTDADRVLRRVEPLPYYFFFPETFPGRYSVRWRGRLHVPGPGEFALIPDSDPPVQVRVDDAPWHVGQRLAAGSHDFELSMTDVSGALRLRLYWERPGGTRELIPPEAFAPRYETEMERQR